jgi:hypothetical protein
MILLKRRGLVSYYKEGCYDPILKKGVMIRIITPFFIIGS